jgi:hypothetical protein
MQFMISRKYLRGVLFEKQKAESSHKARQKNARNSEHF